MSSGATSFLYVWKCCWTQTWDVYVLISALWRGNTAYSQREASQVDAGNARATQRRRPGWRGRGGWGSPGAAGEQVGRRMCAFSHLMNRVIHWSTCASVQFFCPCFWGSQTSAWAFLHLHWYPEIHHLKGGTNTEWVLIRKTGDRQYKTYNASHYNISLYS